MTDESRWWRDGLAVGLIASASVAMFYGVFDLLASRGTFFTVSLLGRAVFEGLRDPAVLQFPMPPDPAAVFYYSVLHVVASLAIGLTVVGLVEQAERQPQRARLVTGVIFAGFVITIVIVGFLTDVMRDLLPIWSVVVANAAATIFAGAYLLTQRPGLLRRLLS